MGDINEKKRYHLWKEIVKIEKKEEDLLTAKKRYEQQLTDFYSDIQHFNHHISNLLEASPESRKLIKPPAKQNMVN